MATVDIQKDGQGRWVGEDGFVVPATTEEFYDRYPDYALMMARKWLRDSTPEAVEDLAQDIWASLLRKRAVEGFDPARVYGATAKQFFHYLSRCTRNTAASGYRQTENDLMTNVLAIDNTGAERADAVTDEQLHANRMETGRAPDIHDRIYLGGLRDYLVRNGEDNVLYVYEAILNGETMDAVAERLGVSHQAVFNRKRRLLALAKAYAGVTR